MSAVASFLAGAGGWLLETEVQVALLVLLIALLQAILGGRLAPRWRHALWMVLAIRLALPVLPPSPFGSPRLLAAPARGSPPRDRGVEIASRDVSAPAPRDNPAGKPIAAALGEEKSARAAPPAPEPPALDPPEHFRWTATLGATWLLGCLGLLATRIAGRCRLVSILREARPAADPDLLRALAGAAERIGVRRIPSLLLSHCIRAPGLAGALRPKILLPADLVEKLSPADLRAIFLHELAHARRRDTATGLLVSLVAAIHWMNPLVWWALGRLREERELACDEAVLRGAPETNPLDYADTILRVARTCSMRNARPVLAGAGIHSGPRLLEKRIRRISSFDPCRGPGTLLAFLLLIVSAALGLTRAPAADPGGPLVTREYPVEALIQPHRDFQAPQLGVVFTPNGVPPDDPRPEELETERKSRLEQLVRLVRSTAFPRSPREGMEIVAEGTSLRVAAPEEVHKEVESLLQRLKAEEGLMVNIETEVLELDEVALEKLSPALARDLRVSAFRGSPLSVSPEDTEALLRTGVHGTVAKKALRITAFDRQVSHNMVIHQETLCVDLRAPVDPKKEPEPVIGILNTGVVIEARPTVSGDRKAIALELGFKKLDVRRPIQSVDVQGGKISVPATWGMEFQLPISLSSGVWGVANISGPSTMDGLLTVVLVRASIVEPGSSAR